MRVLWQGKKTFSIDSELVKRLANFKTLDDFREVSNNGGLKRGCGSLLLQLPGCKA